MALRIDDWRHKSPQAFSMCFDRAHSETTLAPITLEALVLKIFGVKRTESSLNLDQTQA